DSGTALAADHAAVHRVVLIAVDVAHLAVLDMDVDAATAGAHVAGGLGDAVAHAWRGVDAVALVRRARVGQRLLGGCGVGAARLSWAHDPRRSCCPPSWLSSSGPVRACNGARDDSARRPAVAPAGGSNARKGICSAR